MDRKEYKPEKLPKFYRLLLKLPIPTLQRFPNTFQGIFWATIIPLLLASLFFLGLLLIFYLPSPLNIALVITIPTIIFLVFARIRLEQDINFLHLLTGDTVHEWSIEHAVDKYIHLLQNQDDEEQ